MRHGPSCWLGIALVLMATCAHGMAGSSESKVWRLLADASPPPPIFRTPFGVFDPVRQRVLVLDLHLHNTLELNVFEAGATPRWSVVPTLGTPPEGPYLGSAVYDPKRDRLLAVGSSQVVPFGVMSISLSGDARWLNLETMGTPPPSRWGHTTICDPARDRLLVFGGVRWDGSGLYLSDVWELSLATNTWSELSPGGFRPAGREGHGAIYDPVHRRMIVFGGHYEGVARGFWNDVWALSLGDSMQWSELQPSGPRPGARSAFGTVYDPIRRRMLIHGGVNAQSGIEPDDLWSLALDGAPAWTRIETENALRGRSYPVDLYDPEQDRLLACGGGGYPQTSGLDLSSPVRWEALWPPLPPAAPGSRTRQAIAFDARRDRFVVVGGDFSSADSAEWSFDATDPVHWKLPAANRTPNGWPDFSVSSVYDSIGDRLLMFDGARVWESKRNEQGTWTPLSGQRPDQAPAVGLGAGLAIDSRRNRLLVSGGWRFFPHGAGYSLGGVWSLSLDANPDWTFVGALPLPWGSAGHASYYDPARDQLVIVGGYEINDSPRTRRPFGAAVWSTPLDTLLGWTLHSSPADAALPGPPNSVAAFDARRGRVFLARDSTVWVREPGIGQSWIEYEISGTRPLVRSAITYDPIRNQLLALFASTEGSDRVQAWALAVGPVSVSFIGASPSSNAVDLRWSSITAHQREAAVQRSDATSDWVELGPIAFSPEGTGEFSDRTISPGHAYRYRVRVVVDGSDWYSEPVPIEVPGSVELSLAGTPNPSVGRLVLALNLRGPAPRDWNCSISAAPAAMCARWARSAREGIRSRSTNQARGGPVCTTPACCEETSRSSDVSCWFAESDPRVTAPSRLCYKPRPRARSSIG